MHESAILCDSSFFFVFTSLNWMTQIWKLKLWFFHFVSLNETELNTLKTSFFSSAIHSHFLFYSTKLHISSSISTILRFNVMQKLVQLFEEQNWIESEKLISKCNIHFTYKKKENSKFRWEIKVKTVLSRASEKKNI